MRIVARAAPPRPRAPVGDRTPLAGAASLGLRQLLEGPVRPARVLAAFPSAIYIEVPGAGEPRVAAVVTPEAARLPNAVLVTLPARHPALASARAADHAAVGGGSVDLGAVRVRVRRWWDPTPALGPTPRGRLERGVLELRGLLDRAPQRHGLTGHRCPRDLAAACAAGDLAHAVDAAERIMGLGPGLTPSGDDMLSGLLVALQATGAALADGRDARWLAGWLAAGVTSDAHTRTTALAATLLDCAARGYASAEMAAVLHAVAGHEPLQPALARLLATGHTSGADLAWGLLTGCSSALRLAATRQESA